MNEIGSEFHLCLFEKKDGLDIEESSMVFSGRTAIEMVLKKEKSIKKAMLPSYCCDSMIEPFRRAGIKVCFYSVCYDNGMNIQIDIPSDTDCLLCCNYFGFVVAMPDLVAFRNRGGIVIEDITHSFFSMKQFHEFSDYLVASLRKWEPILCGGYCASRKNTIIDLTLQQPPEDFLNKRMNAMKMKRQYLLGETSIDKTTFLHMFLEANEWLSNNYSGLTIDEYSKQYLLDVDYQKHRDMRRKNAKTLYEGLKNNSDIDFLFTIEKMDCPLFVPIVIAKEKRNAIRKKLIDNQIYCPVHWPHPNAECQSNLYEMELSLVCDQRYNGDDMKRIVEVLNN